MIQEAHHTEPNMHAITLRSRASQWHPAFTQLKSQNPN
jgi:hypothetical protein